MQRRELFCLRFVSDVGASLLGAAQPSSDLTLEELENWLTAVEKILRSQPSKPRDLAQCELALKQLKVRGYFFGV
jgi:hypothetical protein